MLVERPREDAQMTDKASKMGELRKHVRRVSDKIGGYEKKTFEGEFHYVADQQS